MIPVQYLHPIKKRSIARLLENTYVSSSTNLIDIVLPVVFPHTSRSLSLSFCLIVVLELVVDLTLWGWDIEICRLYLYEYYDLNNSER